MPDGSTYRAQLESLERQTGKRPTELDGPDLPHDSMHIWAWFLDLAQARGSSGFGPNPIGYQDILAWQTLMGIITRPSEIEAILALDQAWLLFNAGDKAPPPPNPTPPTGKGRR